MKRLIVTLIAAAALACSSTSEPHSRDTTSTQPTNTLIGIIVAPSSVGIGVGDKVQIAATAPASVSTSFIWTSSDSTIALVRATDASGKNVLVTGLKPGTVSITATAFVDPTQSASAVITVGRAYPSGIPTVTITSINEPASGTPANLASANGALAITFSANWPDAFRVDSAAVVVHRSAGDTVVGTVAVPASLRSAGKWTDTVAWNTSARTANGAAVFANGSYTLSVRGLFGTMTTTSTPLSVTLSNP